MAKKPKEEWHLKQEDVIKGTSSFSSGKTGQFNRKLKTTGSSICLTHTPTGIKVEGEIPNGNYTKKEMQQKRNELETRLMIELEKSVAKKLNIRGR